MVWGVLAVLAVGMFFFVTGYWRGLALGLLLLALTGLMIDTFLHARLEIFYTGISGTS